jgi:hypothetical protein
MLEIINIPQKFLPKMPFSYPPHQNYNPMIEERCFDYFLKNQNIIESNYTYLPIQWTSYNINNQYGTYLTEIKNYILELNKTFPNKKFFTVVQYDGGPLVELPNCTIFACCGTFKTPLTETTKVVQLPLLCDPHENVTSKTIKKYKGSFCGRETHHLRKKLFEIFGKNSEYYFNINDSCNLSKENIDNFKNILNDSYFSFCPRGYGPSSYRLYESLQFGSVPVYISDDLWLPFKDEVDWEDFCVLVTPDEMDSLPQKLENILNSEKYNDMVLKGQYYYKSYFNWNKTIEQIQKFIEKN